MNDIGNSLDDLKKFVDAAFRDQTYRTINIVNHGLDIRFRRAHVFFPIHQEIDYAKLMGLDDYLGTNFNLYIQTIYIAEDPVEIVIQARRPAEIKDKDQAKQDIMIEKKDLNKDKEKVVIEVK